MSVNLVCFSPDCGEKYAKTEVLYQCPRCGGLLELQYEYDATAVQAWKKTWRERRMDNAPINQSGVWRYREMLPFDAGVNAFPLREGNTPLLESPITAAYGGLDRLIFKHQGFNPTGSFKDNGMTCGVTQARLLGKAVVACVSTGNTSASMAAYASAAGLKAVIFLPQGNISFGKLAQALEYGAMTLQVEANFDEILALVRKVADCAGVYLLNSINPYRIEGQKTMAIEMADQLDWRVPDWVVMPGGNLGNTAAFGKGFLELYHAGLIDSLPRIAVVQAVGAAPFFDYVRRGYGSFEAVRGPETLATAIRIGDPVSWPKAEAVVRKTAGAVESVTEQEIADAKAIIGRSGIGCEPASAATLAGIRKMTAAGIIRSDESVVAILTGNVLKDPDYIYRYHLGELKSPDGMAIKPNFGNRPQVVEGNANAIIKLLQAT